MCQAIKDWGQLIKEAGREPTHVKELVVGDTSYKGTLDASGEGAGWGVVTWQKIPGSNCVEMEMA